MHLPLTLLVLASAVAGPPPESPSGAPTESWWNLAYLLPDSGAGQVCRGGSYRVGPSSNPGWVGWTFLSGEKLVFNRAFAGLSYTATFFQDEENTYSVTFGVPCGIHWERYVGHGYAFEFDTAVFPRRFQLGVRQYLAEGVGLTCGVDLAAGICDLGWDLQF
jgi:hypothetical protein